MDLIHFVLVFRIASIFQIPFLLLFLDLGYTKDGFLSFHHYGAPILYTFTHIIFLNWCFMERQNLLRSKTYGQPVWQVCYLCQQITCSNFLEQCYACKDGHIWTILPMHIHSWWNERQLFQAVKLYLADLHENVYIQVCYWRAVQGSVLWW